jgi:asparagine synthase (glutamine-hydrolysing)
MRDVTGRWVVTFNGEIYNYRELRSELERYGYVFRTNSDTEVLINVVAAWGEGGLRKLRGMYAFALWDTRDHELWLARDPFGIKPLYVSDQGGTFWFASSARALANCAPVDTMREPAALTGFYLWGNVPEPFTWWAGIRMFPAGHVQRIRAGTTPSAPKPFHVVQESFSTKRATPLNQGELRELLLDSVRHHLVADVPVGVFLSAGVDSTVIAALAAELGSKLRTVTLAFNEYAGTANDEAPLAEETARMLGSEHATVRIDREEFFEILDDFLQSMDQPTIDGLNCYLVSRAAVSQGLKVVLSGLGGDELFGGYPSFRQIPTLLKWGRRIPFSSSLGRQLQHRLGSWPTFGVSPKAVGALAHSTTIGRAYLLRRALFLENELDALLDATWLNTGLERLSTDKALQTIVRPLQDSTDFAQVAALEGCWYMRNQLLRDTDWASMAHGLEVRVPFLDMTLMDRLGPAVASNAPPSKTDLMKCVGHVGLVAGIQDRPKTGFTTPVRNWIADGSSSAFRGLRGWATDVHTHFRTATVADCSASVPLAAE